MTAMISGRGHLIVFDIEGSGTVTHTAEALRGPNAFIE